MSVTPLLSVMKVDHIGITVPDLAQAHDFFVGILGCEYMYRLGPYHDDDGPWMREHLDVDERAVMERLNFYRLGGQAVFEVFQYSAPGQRTAPPRNSDVGGHHVAIYVDDLDESVTALRGAGIRVLGDPTTSRGPSEGQRWVYFLSPWGMQFELVCYPEGKAYDHDPSAFV